MIVPIRYGVSFGKGDSSDWIDYEIELTPEEEVAYNNAIANEIPLEDVDELQSALDRAYDEIESMEIDNSASFGDEFTLECLGQVEMDADELNDLVANRDPYTLKYFGLENASEEELEDWDANDLDEVPMVCDFVEDFEPESPYNSGWTLFVEFVESDEFD